MFARRGLWMVRPIVRRVMRRTFRARRLRRLGRLRWFGIPGWFGRRIIGMTGPVRSARWRRRRRRWWVFHTATRPGSARNRGAGRIGRIDWNHHRDNRIGRARTGLPTAGIREVSPRSVSCISMQPRLGGRNLANDFIRRARVRIADDADRDGPIVGLARRRRLCDHHLDCEQEHQSEDQFLVSHTTSHA